MEIYQVKIALRDTHPRIWRRVLVPRDVTLGKLHRVLQRAMGWTDSHLHRFQYGSGRRSDLRFGLPPKVSAENKTKLGDALTAPGDRLLYEYDFGDVWQHDVRLEKILLYEESFQPVCIAGERACPPEDCGGPQGFAELLDTLRNPEHPEHEDRLEWLGDDFDPEHLDLTEINRKLSRTK
jgi:Plasmid pRiA4b ORF-3-like protein